MTGELFARAWLTNDKVGFLARSDERPPIQFDYPAPIGDGDGLTSLQVLLMSLTVCSATTIVALLRQMRKTIEDFQAHAQGLRRQEHPTGFEAITLSFRLVSPDTSDDEMARVVAMAEETYSPVWTMIRQSADVDAIWEIVSPV